MWRRVWTLLAIAGVSVCVAAVGCSDGEPFDRPLSTVENSIENPRTPKAPAARIPPGASAGGGGPGGTTAACAGVTCANFSTQAAAQAFFLANGCSGLDGDSNGIACQDLP